MAAAAEAVAVEVPLDSIATDVAAVVVVAVAGVDDAEVTAAAPASIFSLLGGAESFFSARKYKSY